MNSLQTDKTGSRRDILALHLNATHILKVHKHHFRDMDDLTEAALQVVYLFRRFVSVSEKPAAAVPTLNRRREEVSEDTFIL